MALVVPEKNSFQHILRLLNTNVDGKEKVMFALTRIKGVGRRYSNVIIKKADVDLNKRYFPNPIDYHWPLPPFRVTALVLIVAMEYN
jgi:hypothetical protein